MPCLSRLNASAAPWEPPVTRAPADYLCPPPVAVVEQYYPPPQSLLPPPPLPPVCRVPVAVSSCGCAACQSFVPMVVPAAFPHAAAGWSAAAAPAPAPPVVPVMIVYRVVQPPPPAAHGTRCRITEIEDGNVGGGVETAKVVAGDEPCMRAVRSTRRRKAAIRLPKAFRAALLPPPPPPCALGFTASTTSLMIRNIPNKFLKARLMAILDQHCADENGKTRRGGRTVVKSEYDFFYVPIDFRTGFNKGYAFVNMTTATAARRLRAFLQAHRWDAAMSGKVCDVVPAALQGLDAFVAHFSASCFACRTKEFLPVWFEPPRDGVQQTKAHVVGRLVVRPR
uniref:Mei2-like C-terminal RNA recognition motif domain-containing protein n=1 Tax=Oryza punctata TaxID=4537 RepID=A0A0E0M3S2_ORYPU